MRHAGVIVLALALPARAEHDHHAPTRAGDDEHVTASAGAIAASYRSRLYDGDYQGASLGMKWTRGRFELSARGSAYQIERNGKLDRGFGDVMVHGAATLVERGPIAAGAHLMVMVPTGDAVEGLGMGHWMVMPAAWVMWSHARVTLASSVGYARGLGGEDAHAEHGGGVAWPLVDPMTFSELTFDGTAMVVLAPSLHAGVRVLGAVPTGGDDTRTIGATRVTWRGDRVEVSVEAQAGITGDPVRMRGLLSTAMRF